ncbi:mucoidy inhibitor MuiA family protein [Peijinzhouia sedimentorum]
MRLIPTLLILLCLGAQALAQQTISSKVSDVVVFPNAAQINRTGVLTLTPGNQSIRIGGLPADLDVSQFTFNIKDADFRIISQSFNRNFLTEAKLSSKEREFKERMDAIAVEMSTLENSKMVLRREEQFLADAYAKQASNLNAITEAARLLSQRLAIIYAEITKIDKKLAELHSERLQIERQQSQLFPTKVENNGELTLIINSSLRGNFAFELAYQTNRARWEPRYDIYSNGYGEDLSIALKANIHQATGEDWDGIKVVLTTANPNSWNTLPELYPWVLDFVDDRVMVRLRGQAKGMQIMEVADEESISDFNVEAGESATALSFTLTGDYYVPTSIAPFETVLTETNKTANYRYQIAPKFNPKAFLVAELTEWREVFTLSAQANVYFQNQLSNRTYVNANMIEDEMLISLGADERIVVERKQILDNTGRGFLGSKRTDIQDFVISIYNPRSEEIEVRVQDQIPLSRNDELVIKLRDGQGAELDTETGILTWNLKIGSKETKEIKFGFSAEYSKDKKVRY